MKLEQHKLYKIALSNIMSWLPDADRTQAVMRQKLKDKSLSPAKRYEIGSFLYCETMVGVFNRLRMIRKWTGRSLSPRKKDSATGKADWLIYNYHNYMVVYASIFEVALQLLNEILDLGILPRDCNHHSILSNRRVEAADIKSIMNNLANTTNEHRQGKNLLFHYGKGTRPPIRRGQPLTLDDSMFSDLGIDDKSIRQYIEEFMVKYDQKELVKVMNNECRTIGSQVEQLFTSLLPYYHRFHSFYS